MYIYAYLSVFSSSFWVLFLFCFPLILSKVFYFNLVHYKILFSFHSLGFIHHESLVNPTRRHMSPEMIAISHFASLLFYSISLPESYFSSPHNIIFLTKQAKLDMLNDFVSF